MNTPFDLFLFSTNPWEIRESVAAGIAGVVIDWEHAGKLDRQHQADTEINAQTIEDLRVARAAAQTRIVCRVNPFGATTREEIDAAVGAGANEVLLPMVRTAEEVRATIRIAAERCGVGILVETMAAVGCVDALAKLPVCRVYVGLNDLMIDRADPCIFSAVLDGTVERVRSAFTVPFGFAGLTVVQHGFPIPCRLLIGEMARLGCSFSFLRRSFHRDMSGRRPAEEIPRILEAITTARHRGPDETASDHRALHAAIRRAYFERPVGISLSP